ncbi:TPA: methyltransferase [Candidatus Micrarchaeota archaeon]|nr:methyltransferase [Candidatus Micrarchaeota archaeon]HIH30345.1 methyltransferase [Candidatus Micrarchaeota archaeon]
MAISFGTLQIECDASVYEPAEDSFLLATYASSLEGRILDIGTGTGIAALSAAYAERRNDVIGVDTNPAAIECAKKNAKLNNLGNVEFLVSDLFAGVSGKFDAILFNPPYLPTSREERLKNAKENAAYDGGLSGLEVFFRFALDVARFLPSGGRAAVIATSLNNGIEQTLIQLKDSMGIASVVAQEGFFFEKIALVEAIMP